MVSASAIKHDVAIKCSVQNNLYPNTAGYSSVNDAIQLTNAHGLSILLDWLNGNFSPVRQNGQNLPILKIVVVSD